MKTLNDIWKQNLGYKRVTLLKKLKQEAIKILKKNKEINTADWIEFFNIEEEFADAILGASE